PMPRRGLSWTPSSDVATGSPPGRRGTLGPVPVARSGAAWELRSRDPRRRGRRDSRGGSTMKALVYHGPGQKAWEEVPEPTIQHPTDAIVRIDTTTICGTDLHILKGDVPAVTDGRILGHEGVGTIVETGSAVSTFEVGDRVII